MEFTLSLEPSLQAIEFVDQTFESYTSLYNLPYKREICFVVHELVINAVEAMRKMEKVGKNIIHIHFVQNEQSVQITVTDYAHGIPQEQWEQIVERRFEDLDYSDRGRGLLFIKHMVDKIWIEHITDDKFLIGVTKILKPN